MHNISICHGTWEAHRWNFTFSDPFRWQLRINRTFLLTNPMTTFTKWYLLPFSALAECQQKPSLTECVNFGCLVQIVRVVRNARYTFFEMILLCLIKTLNALLFYGRVVLKTIFGSVVFLRDRIFRECAKQQRSKTHHVKKVCYRKIKGFILLQIDFFVVSFIAPWKHFLSLLLGIIFYFTSGKSNRMLSTIHYIVWGWIRIGWCSTSCCNDSFPSWSIVQFTLA